MAQAVNEITGEMMDTSPPQRVAVVNLDMEFMTMVWFLVKLAIAAIPAMIILFVIGMVVMGMLGGMARI